MDRVEREMGAGIGMGNTCKSMAISFQCMTKSNTIKKNFLIKKKKEKEVTEDEMVGWHQRLSGHESEKPPGDSEGLRSLVVNFFYYLIFLIN